VAEAGNRFPLATTEELKDMRESPPLKAEDVQQLVLSRTGGKIRDLRVEVCEGVVVLSGRTSTYYNKQLATHAALDAISDTPLSNNIEVS
jgi:hypothetical protein